ncbi:MAG: hypothetical protein L6266_01690, partial [Nanoarchaeota archaeon]|nr:hypothetical protein [Nanoarchaeota archaeon]
MQKKRNNLITGMSVFQIKILILSIIAFGFLIGGNNVGIVRGEIYWAVNKDGTIEKIVITTGDDYTKFVDEDSRYITTDKDYASKLAQELKIGNSGGSTTSTQGTTSTNLPTAINFEANTVREIAGVENVIGLTSTAGQNGQITGVTATLKGGNTQELDIAKLKAEGYITADGKSLNTVTTGADFGDYLLESNVGVATSNFIGHIVSGFQWSLLVLGAIKMLGPMITDDEAMLDALSTSTFAGIMAGKTAYGLIKEGGVLQKFGAGLTEKTWFGAQGWSIGLGVVVALVIFYASYKKESTQTITYECGVWDAPTGGKNCEQCNDMGEGIPCSEYQCRSLGQACELLNPGTGEESCEWVNKNDVSFPVIEPWKDTLLDDYKYTPDK